MHGHKRGSHSSTKYSTTSWPQTIIPRISSQYDTWSSFIISYPVSSKEYTNTVSNLIAFVYYFFQKPSPPSWTSALLKNTLATLAFFTHHIQPILSYKGVNYANLHLGTPLNIQLHQWISRFTAQNTHTNHILYCIPTISLRFAHPQTLTHARLPIFLLQKSTTLIVLYQITSLILRKFYNTHSHTIFSQHLSPITPIHIHTHTHTHTHIPETSHFLKTERAYF